MTAFITTETGWPPTLHLGDDLFADDTLVVFDSDPEEEYYLLYGHEGSEIIKIEHAKMVSRINAVRAVRGVAGTKRLTFSCGTAAFPGHLKEEEENAG